MRYDAFGNAINKLMRLNGLPYHNNGMTLTREAYEIISNAGYRYRFPSHAHMHS